MHSVSSTGSISQKWSWLIGALLVGALTVTLIKGYEYKHRTDSAKSAIVRQDIVEGNPENIPNNLPLTTTSSTVLSNYTMTLPTGESQGIKRWVVLKSPADTSAAYNTYLTTNGWTISLNATAGDTRVVGAYNATQNIRISISPIPANPNQSIIEVAASGGVK